MLGAQRTDSGVNFEIWAPNSEQVHVVIERAHGVKFPLASIGDGIFRGVAPSARSGDRYWFDVDGVRIPDPASRSQPDGPEGASEIEFADEFVWSDSKWRGIRPERAIIYELHVGTFSPEGTFRGVEERLDHLLSLGVTAIQLMPIGEFAGEHGWGYDGVSIFAPHHAYGRPDELRRLVDAAHQSGLAVLLDVVYNHFGPRGNYLHQLSPQFFCSRTGPWGASLNLDGPHSRVVRQFFVENALHWILDYHLDGLRFDATHELVDSTNPHLITEIVATARETCAQRDLLFIAEDDRNLRELVISQPHGGWGLDAVWADDFHHHLHRRLTGETGGYYRNFSGSANDLADTIRHGWFYRGQKSHFTDKPRGTETTGLLPHNFVFCLQNHDQIGNRPLGERLASQISDSAYRAASALLLLAPQMPLLFMGQEWGEKTPFRYFTDHDVELGRAVTEGRRNEFGGFIEAAGLDPAAIPDPQEDATFTGSKLDWPAVGTKSGRGMIELYRRLISLRCGHPAFESVGQAYRVNTLTDETIALLYPVNESRLLVALIHFGGVHLVDFNANEWLSEHATRGLVLLCSEDPVFGTNGGLPKVNFNQGNIRVEFSGPCAIIVEWC